MYIAICIVVSYKSACTYYPLLSSLNVPYRYGLSVVIKLPVVCRASTLLMIIIYLTIILASSQGKLARNS